jgi:uncharacterized membrane protein
MIISDMAHSYLPLEDQSLLRICSFLLLCYILMVYYEEKHLLCLCLCNIVMWKDKIILLSGCLGIAAGLVCEGKNIFCLLSSRGRLQASGSFIY